MQCIFGYFYKYTQRPKTGFVLQGHTSFHIPRSYHLLSAEWLSSPSSVCIWACARQRYTRGCLHFSWLALSLLTSVSRSSAGGTRCPPESMSQTPLCHLNSLFTEVPLTLRIFSHGAVGRALVCEIICFDFIAVQFPLWDVVVTGETL